MRHRVATNTRDERRGQSFGSSTALVEDIALFILLLCYTKRKGHVRSIAKLGRDFALCELVCDTANIAEQFVEFIERQVGAFCI